MSLDLASGKQLWSVNIVQKFRGGIPHWGISESPLIDGNKVIVGTVMQPFWVAHPGLEKRLEELAAIVDRMALESKRRYGRGIDLAIRDQGLDEVLQTAYFRIVNAMATARLQQSNMVAFMNQKVVDQRVIAVYFDKNRRVRRLANYGLQDGKIFDFISRTTATSGQEMNYLTPLFKLLSFN